MRQRTEVTLHKEKQQVWLMFLWSCSSSCWTTEVLQDDGSIQTAVVLFCWDAGCCLEFRSSDVTSSSFIYHFYSFLLVLLLCFISLQTRLRCDWLNFGTSFCLHNNLHYLDYYIIILF